MAQLQLKTPESFNFGNPDDWPRCMEAPLRAVSRRVRTRYLNGHSASQHSTVLHRGGSGNNSRLHGHHRRRTEAICDSPREIRRALQGAPKHHLRASALQPPLPAGERKRRGLYHRAVQTVRELQIRRSKG